MTPNAKLVKELTDEELEKRIQEFDYELPNELLLRFKVVKMDLAEMKVQLDRAIKEAIMSDKECEEYKDLFREVAEHHREAVENLIECRSRLSYYEGDDE